MDVNLLEKTEIRIDGIVTEGTNLTELAELVAKTLGLPQGKVMVIDVRPNQVALDVLVRTAKAESFFGKEAALLAALASVPGVKLSPDAQVHSAGILGAIALAEDEAAQALARSAEMGATITASRKARIRVFPTGFELEEGRIEDTNTPYLVKVLGEAGYLAEPASPLADRLGHLVAALSAAASECGVVVTTGGVGAEDKDFSVEAIERIDPSAAAPYLVRFTRGEGRHVKDGIRIGVGEAGGCLLVALPGPHDEVRLAAPVLILGLKQGWDKAMLAERLAEAVRAKFRDQGWPHAHHHHHHDGDDGHHHRHHDHPHGRPS